jgi:hypothetical protein
MQQAAASLYSMLLHGNASTECLKNIIFELSDYIVYHPDESRGENFLLLTKRHKPHILILGSSAHYDRVVAGKLANVGTPEFMDFFVPKLVKDVEYLRLWPAFSPKYILFKTQNPGHVHCETFTMPVSNTSGLSFADPVSSSSSSNHTQEDKYSWRSHTFTDAHVLKFFLDSDERNKSALLNRTELGVIDMSPVYLRPDGHAGLDCLHFCTPGPLDLFSIFLLSSLRSGELV